MSCENGRIASSNLKIDENIDTVIDLIKADRGLRKKIKQREVNEN